MSSKNNAAKENPIPFLSISSFSSIRGGCESVIHATSSLLHSAGASPDQLILQVDLDNAYNNVDRAHFISETRKHFPALSSWVETAYGQSSHLFYQGRRLWSSQGTKQGDPLGGILFGLGLQPTINRILTEVPTLKANMWIMDDGTLCGSRDDLRSVISILEEEGPGRGLFLNKSKSSIWCGNNFTNVDDPLACGVPKASPSGLNLLGSPIGVSGFMVAEVHARVSKIEDVIVNRLSCIEDPQIQLCLLRSCLSIPKLMYTLRTCKPSVLKPVLDRFDDIIFNALESIVGSPLSHQARCQASLPVSLGGLGLRSASDHATAAFLSSVLQSKPTVDRILVNAPHLSTIDTPLALFRTAAGSLPSSLLDNLSDPSSDISQKSLSFIIDSNLQRNLLEHAVSSGDLRSSARLRSLSLPLSGAFLNSIPSHVFGLSILPQNCRIALQYRQ